MSSKISDHIILFFFFLSFFFFFSICYVPGMMLTALGHDLLRPQSCLTLCNPMDRSPWGSSVQGIFQPRILEWVAISSSRASSPPRARTCIFCSSYIGRQIFTPEIPGKPVNCFKGIIILFNPHNGMRHCFIILYKWGLPWCLRW